MWEWERETEEERKCAWERGRKSESERVCERELRERQGRDVFGMFCWSVGKERKSLRISTFTRQTYMINIHGDCSLMVAVPFCIFVVSMVFPTFHPWPLRLCHAAALFYYELPTGQSLHTSPLFCRYKTSSRWDDKWRRHKKDIRTSLNDSNGHLCRTSLTL